jgi:hypothetical protein
VEHSTRQRLHLAGKWDLAFDSAGEGLSAGWPAAWPGNSETVAVPALWTVTHPDVTGVGFYRKVFAVPAAWAGQVVYARFGGASYRLDAWLNGTYIGGHEGAYTPFAFDITRALRTGADNALVLRVASLSKTGPVDGLLLHQCPASKQLWYYIEAGLWGDVYLEARPPLWCEAVSVEPDLERRNVLVEVEARNGQATPRQAALRLVVTDAAGRAAVEATSTVALLPGATRHAFRLPLDRPTPWSCENPALYRVQATLEAEGLPSDSLTTRFGMRDFTARDGQFLLNGQPIYLRGVLLQPNYPVTLIAPPTPDMMRREISLTKQAGFNMIRTHIRPSPPGYLDLCDEMGMLVYAEACMAWIKDSPRLLEHGRREMEAMIRRDKNHPSVVFWGVYNENRPASALTSDELLRFTRALDPTRVVVDNSGGSMAIDQDFGWVERASVIPNRQTERQKIIDVHIYTGAPIPHGVYEWLRTLGAHEPPADMSAFGFSTAELLAEFSRELRSYRGQVFVSELGCGGMSDLDDTVERFDGRDLVDARELRVFRDGLAQGFAARHLERVFGTVRNLVLATQEAQAAGNVRQVEAIMANPRVSGYVVTQLNDVAWEFHAGLLDLWRNPKKVYFAMQRLNRPQCLILKAASAVAACGQRLPLTITLVNSVAPAETCVLSTVVYDPQQVALFTQTMDVPAQTGVVELATLMIGLGDTTGEHRVVARLLGSNGTTLAETTESIYVLPPVDSSEACRTVAWLGDPPFAGAPHEQTPRPAATAASRSSVLGVARPSTLDKHDWHDLLRAVESGSVAIVGPLHPQDTIALAALTAHDVGVKLHMSIGNWMGCYHWIPESPLFAGLPAGGLAGEAYVDVLPRYALSEQGGDILAGSLRNTQTRLEPPAILWYSDVEAVRFGKGALLFCQYRVFDKGNANPLAARLLCNVIEVARSYL